MFSEGREKAQIGKVKVDIHGRSYRIRFTYPQGHRHSFSIARVSLEGWTTAIKAAQLIDRDIALGDFDDTYARYSPGHAKRLEISKVEAQKIYNLKDLWTHYKKESVTRVAQTTQNNLWIVLDNALSKCDKKNLELSQAKKFVEYLNSNYANSTIRTLFRTCIDPCVNLAVKDKKIPENPYDLSMLPREQKKNIECFEPEEVKAIIQAFYEDRFMSPKSVYADSYYAPMVEFIALTGCRPEEIHALTWDDIRQSQNKTQILFRKVYSNGVFMKGTKNKIDRIFPCNNQLRELIDRLPRIENKMNLVFPSVRGGYMTQRNFRTRFWNRILNGLVQEGSINKRLKPYCLRHSFITRLVRQGVDVATIAALSGNSPKMIMDNYLASRRDFDLPEL